MGILDIRTRKRTFVRRPFLEPYRSSGLVSFYLIIYLLFCSSIPPLHHYNLPISLHPCFIPLPFLYPVFLLASQLASYLSCHYGGYLFSWWMLCSGWFTWTPLSVSQSECLWSVDAFPATGGQGVCTVFNSCVQQALYFGLLLQLHGSANGLWKTALLEPRCGPYSLAWREKLWVEWKCEYCNTLIRCNVCLSLGSLPNLAHLRLAQLGNFALAIRSSCYQIASNIRWHRQIHKTGYNCRQKQRKVTLRSHHMPFEKHRSNYLHKIWWASTLYFTVRRKYNTGKQCLAPSILLTPVCLLCSSWNIQ